MLAALRLACLFDWIFVVDKKIKFGCEIALLAMNRGDCLCDFAFIGLESYYMSCTGCERIGYIFGCSIGELVVDANH